MTTAAERAALPSWRRRLHQIRIRLRPLRVYLAVVAGAAATVLSTVYETIPSALRYSALIAVALLSGVVLLLTDVGTPAPADYSRDVSGDWPTSVSVGAQQGPRWRRRSGSWYGPTGIELFTGRNRELDKLLRRHDEQRARRTPGTAGRSENGAEAIGCVSLYLHGQPGVGKSAIARELAARLAPQYRHGVVSVDLGTAGTGRPPGDILKDLLLQLGWDEREMPADPRGRAVAFRSKTRHKQLLFIFDAARTADQVKMILPTDPANAVIVTSRRDLTSDPEMQATPSFLVEVPTPTEALEIFRTMSRTDDLDRPECAAEIVEQCGRLPVAIRSAAERIAAERTDICAVRSYLGAASTRLSRLEQPGRPVHSLLQTEFDRLLPNEQQALTYLALLPSSSFSPWILMPLLDIAAGEAEALADRLVASQMLEMAKVPGRAPLARYTMPPLIGLFARRLAEDVDPDQRKAATARVDDAYQSLLASVMAALRTDGGGVPQHNGFSYPRLASAIAAELPAWVEAEYDMVLHQIQVAYAAGRHELCWQLSEQLNGIAPRNLDYDATVLAYETALMSANTTAGSRAQEAVRMAMGRFFATVGRYDHATSEFETAVRPGEHINDEQPGSFARRKIAIDLALGETLVQAGSHDFASEVLERCLQLAGDEHDYKRTYAAEILIAYNAHVECPYWVIDRLNDGTLDETGRFYARLAFADSVCRGEEWPAAFRHLALARQMSDDGSIARSAFVAVRTAETRLRYAHQILARTPSETAEIRRQIGLAIEWACIAMRQYRQMRYAGGEYRARCCLARAFGTAGYLGVAEQLIDQLETDAESMHNETDKVHRGLVARVRQARGELLYRFGDAAPARTKLIQAAALFSVLGDPVSEKDVRQTIQNPPIPRQRTARP